MAVNLCGGLFLRKFYKLVPAHSNKGAHSALAGAASAVMDGKLPDNIRHKSIQHTGSQLLRRYTVF